MAKQVTYTIKDIRRFGAICFIDHVAEDEHCSFAWQILRNEALFSGFSKEDQIYIRTMARLEDSDSWYEHVGRFLFKKFNRKFIKFEQNKSAC